MSIPVRVLDATPSERHVVELFLERRRTRCGRRRHGAPNAGCQ